MGTITSGIGLVSGINTADLINKLIAIDAQPVNDLQTRIATMQTQETALKAIQAQVTALQGSLTPLTNINTFNNTTASSSDSSVLTATTTNTSPPGTYSFYVSQLVTAQQAISQGFSDTSTTPVGAGTLTFSPLAASVSNNALLSELNGGQGISRGSIRITDGAGNTAIVDLSKAASVNDVLNDINSASGINVTASIQGDHFVVADNSGASVTALKITNVGSTNTAGSLGLTGASSGGVITGSSINYLASTTLLSSLNDGNGVARSGTGTDLTFTGDQTFSVNLSSAKTIGDVISAINGASGNTSVTASLAASGTGLTLTYTGTNPLSVSGTSAADLGISLSNQAAGTVTGGRLIANLNSTLLKNLNGGAGVGALGTISITNRAGSSFNVDLSGAQSLSDVIDAINSASQSNNGQITAAVNNAGDGIVINDTTGASSSNLIISGPGTQSGTGLNIAANTTSSSVDSGDLNKKFVSTGTLLSTLNGGKGVTTGNFQITDSRGVTSTIAITSSMTTVQDVLNAINKSGLDVQASINQNGDGILLHDTGPGTSAITVAESGSTTAQSLGLLGSAPAAGQDFVGSFANKVTIAATDTLSDVVNKINAASIGIRATIVNDGSPNNPYRLSLTAAQGGTAGGFVLNDGGLGLGVQNLVEAQNAVVFYGSSNAASSVPIISTSNTLSNLIVGTTIDLTGTSNQAVTLSISQDTSGLISDVNSVITNFNSVVDALNQNDTYDTTTNQAGLLLGDPTVESVRSSLYNLVNSRNTDLSTQYTTLAQIGITVDSNGHLQLDQNAFTQALNTDRNAVVQLFTYKQTTTDPNGNTILNKGGIGARLADTVNNMVDPVSGLFVNRTNAIDAQVALNNNRINELNDQLAAKRQQLQTEFNNMEQALAQLQSQGSALNSLTNLLGSTTSSSSSSGSSGTSSTSSSSSSSG